MFLALWIVCVKSVKNPRSLYGVLNDEILNFEKLLENNDLAQAFELDEKIITLFSYIASLPFANAAYFAIELIGNLFYLVEFIFYSIATLILPASMSPRSFDSTEYPDLFNKPWMRSSLIEFWSKGWHSLFRRHILVCGWKPFELIFSPLGSQASKIAGMMGAMIFSGLFHEYTLAAASKVDYNFPTMKVFILMGVGMILEGYFKTLTGRKVNGLTGYVWMSLIVGFAARDAVLSWIERGLASSGITDVENWTWHRYFIPFGAILPECWISYLYQS
ncbi:hypothetical protein BY996DRAFT_7660763 [Phakopsora pachyrhizi]|nr:hypothetical protein BY996DRAFT_7660763 [Phakopsora pachyrhizi]